MTDFPKRISINFHEGFCNLSCPKCFLADNKGIMNPEKGYKLLTELIGQDTVLSIDGQTEPFTKDCWKYLEAARDKGIKVNINTNGLLLKDTDRLVSLVDGVFISIDATTKETLMKTRGTDKLEKIKETVFALLKARRNRLSPRIGVSFVIEKANAHEKEEFVDFWIKYVDAVRVAELFNSKEISESRQPCSILYNIMLIRYNGDVPLCCWGGKAVANVFKQSIKEIWSEKFQKEADTCKNCNDWPRYLSKQKIVDKILINSSPLLTYYNRIDRLNSWKK